MEDSKDISPGVASHAHRSIHDTKLSTESFNQILCPNLRIGVRMGLLNPDQHGWVTSREMKSFLEYIGTRPDSFVENLLISAGENASGTPKIHHINITRFQGTSLDHGSSSGILNNKTGFSQERLDYLKHFSADKKYLLQKDLAAAASHFHKQPVNFKSIKGTTLQSFELASILELYGRKSKSGESYFTLDDIDAIWKQNRFPKDWQPPVKSTYGTFQVILKFFTMTFARILKT